MIVESGKEEREDGWLVEGSTPPTTAHASHNNSRRGLLTGCSLEPAFTAAGAAMSLLQGVRAKAAEDDGGGPRAVRGSGPVGHRGEKDEPIGSVSFGIFDGNRSQAQQLLLGEQCVEQNKRRTSETGWQTGSQDHDMLEAAGQSNNTEDGEGGGGGLRCRAAERTAHDRETQLEERLKREEEARVRRDAVVDGKLDEIHALLKSLSAVVATLPVVVESPNHSPGAHTPGTETRHVDFGHIDVTHTMSPAPAPHSQAVTQAPMMMGVAAQHLTGEVTSGAAAGEGGSKAAGGVSVEVGGVEVVTESAQELAKHIMKGVLLRSRSRLAEANVVSPG